MQFDCPYALILLVIIPFLWEPTLRRMVKAGGLVNSRDELSITFSSRVSVSELPKSARIRYRAPVLNILRSLAFALLVLALARPQTGISFSEVQRTGRDIMLALDLSGSMQAMDFTLKEERVNRLEALKSVVNTFIDGRKGDRIGLVVFGDRAFTQCPLTSDHKVVKDLLDSLQIGMAGNSTAVGDALGIAIKRVKDIESDSKVIVLVTDGKSNAGAISPQEAAKLATAHKIKVHTIGIGGNGTAPFPQQGMFGGVRLVNVPVEFDEETLTSIANSTGGVYFNAKDTKELESVYQEIDKLEEREEIEYEHVEYTENYEPFVAIGLCLYLLHYAIASTIFLKIP